MILQMLTGYTHIYKYFITISTNLTFIVVVTFCSGFYPFPQTRTVYPLYWTWAIAWRAQLFYTSIIFANSTKVIVVFKTLTALAFLFFRRSTLLLFWLICRNLLNFYAMLLTGLDFISAIFVFRARLRI
jgi:hypothetical protein